MRKSIFVSLMLAFAVALSAQEKKTVEFTETTHDFGTIREGTSENGKITHVFTFKNVGSTPIFIENAKASCGCTTPKVDKTKPILPNETGEIPVIYNKANQVGSFHKNVTITFKDGNDNSFNEIIHIKGKITPKEQETQPAN